MNSDREVKGDHRGYMTARDVLVYVAPDHGDCTVVAKKKVQSTIVFRCVCKTIYHVTATKDNVLALRNVPEDRKL